MSNLYGPLQRQDQRIKGVIKKNKMMKLLTSFLFLITFFLSNILFANVELVREATNNKYCPLLPYVKIQEGYDEFTEFPWTEFIFDESSRNEIYPQIFRYYAKLRDSLPELSPREEAYLKNEFASGGDRQLRALSSEEFKLRELTISIDFLLLATGRAHQALEENKILKEIKSGLEMENRILSVINQLKDINFMKLDISLRGEFTSELIDANIHCKRNLKELRREYISLLEDISNE